MAKQAEVIFKSYIQDQTALTAFGEPALSVKSSQLLSSKLRATMPLLTINAQKKSGFALLQPAENGKKEQEKKKEFELPNASARLYQTHMDNRLSEIRKQTNTIEKVQRRDINSRLHYIKQA